MEILRSLPRFHFRCRARPRSQIVPNGRLRLNAFMKGLATPHDASVQMIDTSIVRVHQHAACITRNRRQVHGPSRGGLTSKVHAVVDTNGLTRGDPTSPAHYRRGVYS
jgi:hypothetical protein